MLDETLAGLLASVSGGKACLLVGTDGMIVAGSGEAGDVSWELVVASYADLVRRIGGIHREAGIDDPFEVVVSAPAVTIVVRKVTADYALLLALGPDGVLGRARFELRRAASRIESEVSS